MRKKRGKEKRVSIARSLDRVHWIEHLLLSFLISLISSLKHFLRSRGMSVLATETRFVDVAFSIEYILLTFNAPEPLNWIVSSKTVASCLLAAKLVAGLGASKNWLLLLRSIWELLAPAPCIGSRAGGAIVKSSLAFSSCLRLLSSRAAVVLSVNMGVEFLGKSPATGFRDTLLVVWVSLFSSARWLNTFSSLNLLFRSVEIGGLGTFSLTVVNTLKFRKNSCFIQLIGI